MARPELWDPTVAALPPEVRWELESTLQGRRHPAPLTVAEPDGWWACMACGAAFDDGDAVIIRSVEMELTYCGACISLAAQAIGAV